MPTGKQGPTTEENTLFWLERTVNAMRAARGRGYNRQEQLNTGYSADGGGLFDTHVHIGAGVKASQDNEITGLSMPEPCWKRFNRHIRTIATYCGLTVTIKERYIDPLGVVYVEFARRV